MRVFLFVIMIFNLAQSALAADGPRQHRDGCETLISKLTSNQYSAVCQDRSYNLISPLITGNNGSVVLAFNWSDDSGSGSLVRYRIQPTKFQDEHSKDFRILCQENGLEVSYASTVTGQRVWQKLDVNTDQSVHLQSKFNDTLNVDCKLSVSDTANQSESLSDL